MHTLMPAVVWDACGEGGLPLHGSEGLIGQADLVVALGVDLHRINFGRFSSDLLEVIITPIAEVAIVVVAIFVVAIVVV